MIGQFIFCAVAPMVETVICLQYNGTFSKDFCAKSHERSNSKEAIALMWRTKCRQCPVGAKSLGSDEYLDRSTLFGSKICSRCERQSNRLVRGVICLSCYNRELEHITGLNAKGNPLKLVRTYYFATVNFVTLDGETKQQKIKAVLNREEAIRSIQLTQPDYAKIIDVVLQKLPLPCLSPSPLQGKGRIAASLPKY